MGDLRQRLADALAQEIWQAYVVETGRALPEGLADKMANTLLSLPGIAIVDAEDIKYAFSSPHLGYDRYRAAIDRLLAAADAAEREARD